MLNYTDCNITSVSVHHIGNKTNGEELLISGSALDIADLRLQELLIRFFTQPFKNPEFYNFTFSNEDFTLNALYNFASKIFEGHSSFHKNSVDIAKYLYELSVHPQIKSGDLFIAYFTNIQVDNETADAIGIFKSENRQPFIRLDVDSDNFMLQYHDGINIDKLDKGCLILNLKKDQGYNICIVDKSNKSLEAQYWKDGFLQLKPCSDEYHQTKEFLTITKNFITNQLPSDIEVDKPEQIDLLNRSVEYFKTHESFIKDEFEQEVFQNQDIIESFRGFDNSYREENKIDPADNFTISPQAVKKQSRVFKSVLKLDKNFHIYIHGDRELIERGVDGNGRKFYKIYYNTEE